VFRWQGERLILEIKVISKSRLGSINPSPYPFRDRRSLKIRAMPIDGQASHYLKTYLGQLFSVSQSRVVIEKGHNPSQTSVRIILLNLLPKWFLSC
jgi:uncharacterized protein YggU (UPF0235/DUF167 family)